ncbi:uncharacterized protein BDR25DRAFT_28479 [Lindgomyces ingoldianus]|uniref:Uncharacterized protein n=1 Tax=Lindgomyces ingoldianus TaxID=673940 RepID=A0ACB6QVC5_9PLEO|nr:uncharacterized protein BDR25DRAFT_28479 [Lindgomyces ingoldianus]KAF2470953.1 hypothetical protein BDR25DRAFT_28479 [Lindgomyces ingoldianus]
MTAQSVGIFTIEFPDPYTLSYYNDKFVTLGTNISFQYPITSNIQTLSSKAVQSGNDPYGILYLPDLQSDGCKQSEENLVPKNATRLRNLPQGTDYSLVALAPWFAPNCVLEYFEAARAAPVKAFLVYQLDQGNAMPPLMNDPSWGLDDGGRWKSANHFPVYALSSISGSIVMDQLSKYSGNLTDAPHGHDLASLFRPTDYVRLWATINTNSGNQLPSLWVFLVIVLGLLIAIIVTTSCFMHLIQRRRRNDLRHRVISGEVDLEALGVKRLTVPRQYLEKLPLYAYTAGPRDADLEKQLPQQPAPTHNLPSPTIEAETGVKSLPVIRPSSAPNASTLQVGALPAFSQPTCPICLDDFEPNESQVRELPCRHIFHPDCVDTFLLSNSSLCPMCKKSVLPSGYCPAKITNVMVRRERMIRRMRARSSANRDSNTAQGPVASLAANPSWRGVGSLGSRIGGAVMGRRVFSAPVRTQPRPPDIEMAGAGPPSISNNSPPNHGPEILPVARPSPGISQGGTTEECSQQPTTPRQNRREWARQRALTLLGHQSVPPEVEEEENGAPRWRRGLRRVFPGFR